MISKELIERINFLARKSRAEGLTAEEKDEQVMVRKQYVDAIKIRVKDTLENTRIIKDTSEAESSCCESHQGTCNHEQHKH